MGSVTYETLEHVAMQARPYPSHLLEGCETGLCLFAAAFLGHNDAIHFAQTDMREVTCVDIDHERLADMRRLYPQDWNWVVMDAWEFAAWHRAMDGPLVDVVSVDTFTGDAMRRSLDSLDLWCSLASKAVTVTHVVGASYETPAGWRSSLYPRSADVNWLVLEKMGLG